MKSLINKNWMLLLLALVMGITAAYLGNQAVQERMAELDAKAQEGQVMVEVVVANRDLAQGEVLLAQEVALRKIPKQYSHASAIDAQSFAQIERSRLLSPVKRGETILQSHLEGLGERVFSSVLQKGMRALTFEVDEISSTAGMLRPGDRVDLIYAVKPSSPSAANTASAPEHFVFPLLSNVLVMATGQSLTKQDFNGAQRRYTSVTLEVSPAQANQILLAKASGEVTAILRNPDDQSPNDAPALTPEALLSALNRPAPSQPTIIKRPSIEYMVGGGSSQGLAEIGGVLEP